MKSTSSGEGNGCAQSVSRFENVASVPLQSQDNNNILAYWLSNTSTLLFLLQLSLNFEDGGSAGDTLLRRKRSNSVTLTGRMTQVSDLCAIMRRLKDLC